MNINFLEPNKSDLKKYIGKTFRSNNYGNFTVTGVYSADKKKPKK